MIWAEILDWLRWFALLTPILYFGYFLLPCGFFYYYFYVLKRERMHPLKILPDYPGRKDIIREIRWASLTILVFSAGGVFLREWILEGRLRVYLDWEEYPLWYVPVSFILFWVAHDIYLYWIHRFMHLRRVFPFTHRVHHKSFFPTPFAVFAFQPTEAILQFIIFPALLLVIPMHLWVLIIYLIYNLIANIGGHVGFEILPASFFRNPLTRYSASPTSHQIHHIRFLKNFGGYTNVWDRLMGTHLEEVPASPGSRPS